MLGYNSLIQALAEALAVNIDIATFLTHCGYGSLSVFVGEDAANPLGETQTPYIILAPSASASDMAECQETVNIGIEIDFGIVKKGETTANSITTYTGIPHTDAFAQLVYKAVAGALGEFQHITKADYALIYDRFPLFEGGISFTVEVEQGVSDS